MSRELRIRPTVRLVVIDDADRLLLLGGLEEDGSGRFWFTPGGGMEPGESIEQTARREMHEETGLVHFDLGPPVWTRQFQARVEDDLVWLDETAYLVQVVAFEPDDRGFTEIERAAKLEFRWWSITELLATIDRLAPRELSQMFDHVLKYGPPDEPFALIWRG